MGDHQSNAVRSEDAQTIRACRLQHGLRPRPEACRQNDYGARSFAAEIVDQTRYGGWRRGDYRQIRRHREIFHRCVTVPAFDLGIFWINQADVAGEVSRQQVARHRETDGAGLRACAYQGDGFGRRQSVRLRTVISLSSPRVCALAF